MEPLNPSHYPTSRAVAVAVSCFNYNLGGPYRLYEKEQVTKASKESIEGVGNKYHLEFSIKDALNEQQPIQCTAEVLYHTNQQTAPNVTYKLQSEPQNYTAEKDKEFYSRMKGRSEPLVAGNIPDKFGNVAPDMEPILHLAQAASDFVKWQMSTEGTFYSMSVIDCVKQLKTEDPVLGFQINMLIHEMVSQEMELWSIDVQWGPAEGIKVKNQKRLPKSR